MATTLSPEGPIQDGSISPPIPVRPPLMTSPDVIPPMVPPAGPLVAAAVGIPSSAIPVPQDVRPALPNPPLLPLVPSHAVPRLPLRGGLPTHLMGVPPPHLMGSPPLMSPPPPHVLMNPLMMGSSPPELSPRDNESGPVWLEHRTIDGQSYYSDPTTQRTVWERPVAARIIPYKQHDTLIGNIPTGPPIPSGVPLVSQRVWSDYQTPDGKVYYYNKVTRQSIWEKPKDFDLVMPLPSTLDTGPTQDTFDDSEQSSHLKQKDLPHDFSVGSPKSLMDTPFPVVPRPEKCEPEPMEVNSKELLALVAAKLGTGPPPPLATTAVTKSTKPGEKKVTRPVESTPVPGTPWSVVFTNDGRRFFFDATRRKSVWSTPEELENLPIVMKILENPPWRRKRVGELEEPLSNKRMKLAAALDDDDDEENEHESSVPPAVGPPPPPPLASRNTETVMEDRSQGTVERNNEMKAIELRATLPLEERQEMFKAMLLERGVSAFSTWEKELPKFVFDERYQLLVTKERRTAFDEFVASRAEAEMKEKKLKVKEKKEKFLKFLQESKITTKTTFNEFCRQNSKNEKFKIIEKMKERETLFNEYINELKKQAKLHEEERKKAQKDKAEKEKNDFLSMLKEEEKLNEKSQWKKSSQREELFNKYIKSLTKKGDDKQDLVAASLREREREVQMSRSLQEREWDAEKEQLRKTEAQNHFLSLLVDLVKDPQSSWTDTRRQLKKDQRWELSEHIEISDKEKMFRDHISKLAKKRRLQFRKLLEETPKITLTMPWKKARKYIKDDIRYTTFSDNDHTREEEYDYYLRDKLLQAKEEFKSLLQETKLITYKTKESLRDSDKNLKDIIETLKNDKRYLVLDCIESERHEILMDYIDKLHQRGPPPPPTASERLRK